MKVSIITATYNSADTILHTLNSLSSQSYNDIEYIVVDGGSTDSTLEIINSFSTLHPLIISEPDNGIYFALNKGLSLASGNIVGFLHSDDFFAYSDAILDIVNLIDKENSDAVYADLKYVCRSNVDEVSRNWVSGHYNRLKLYLGWMPAHPTFYMRLDLYKSLGFFDTNFKISADYDSVLRYLSTKNIRVSYLNKCLIKMRSGGISNRSIKNILLKTNEDRLVLKKNKIFWPLPLIIKNFSKFRQFLFR